MTTAVATAKVGPPAETKAAPAPAPAPQKPDPIADAKAAMAAVAKAPPKAVPKPAVAPSKPASRLGLVKKEQIRQPPRIVCYGPEGIGKTSLAADAPDPLFLDIDDGSSRLTVSRYSFRDEPGGHVPRTYAEVVAAVDDLTYNEHAFQTLVIDTGDRLEALIHRHMCDRDSGSPSVKGRKLRSISDYGFGKGIDMAVDEWRAFCVKLDRLRMLKSMTILILAHAQIRTFKNPSGEDFDRYTLRINEKAAGFLREWADATAFATFEEGGSKLDPDGRAKGWSTGRRIMHFTRTAAYDAKSRIALPKEVELDPMRPWAPLAVAIDEGMNLTKEQLAELIAAETARLGDEDLAAKVSAAVLKAGDDTQALSRYLMDLRSREPQQEETTNE